MHLCVCVCVRARVCYLVGLCPTAVSDISLLLGLGGGLRVHISSCLQKWSVEHLTQFELQIMYREMLGVSDLLNNRSKVCYT